MTEKPSRKMSTTSTGHTLSESSYLDARFLAAQPEYKDMLRWVGVEKSWHVLDAGSGGGVYLPLLCELVGAEALLQPLTWLLRILRLAKIAYKTSNRPLRSRPKLVIFSNFRLMKPTLTPSGVPKPPSICPMMNYPQPYRNLRNLRNL